MAVDARDVGLPWKLVVQRGRREIAIHRRREHADAGAPRDLALRAHDE